MTVSNALEPFLMYCRVERQQRPESLEKMRGCFRSWLVPYFGELPIDNIKPIHLLSFRQAMADKHLSAARQGHLLLALKLFLKFSRTILEINCLDPDTIRLPKRKTPDVQYLTNEEIKSVREWIDTSRVLGIRMRTIFETLLASGMRISELLSLNRDSISPETKEAAIIGKGGKKRTVFFSEDSLYWIRRYLATRRDSHPALFVTYGDEPKRLTRGDVPRLMQELGRRAGIKKRLHPHLLRHTYCTNLRNNGADISLIKDLAGHQNINTTARYYLGADKEILRNAVSKYLNYGNDREKISPAP